MKTTNYYNTFIAVADDCPVKTAEIPPQKGDSPSVATVQFEMIQNNPYEYTSDDVIFGIYALKNKIDEEAMDKARENFFSKGQACLRASPLTKRYGWGVHSNAEGKIAIFPVESAEYQTLAADEKLKVVKAMRSKRA